MRYKAAREFLDSLVNYEKTARPRNQFKLDALRRLLKLAGNPQLRIKKVILIAGTKGKGSAAYMVEAGLRGCGMRTGLFVSPHVLSVRERIQLDGVPVSRPRFTRLIERFIPLVRRQRVSYFELMTALAFDLFARAGVDYAIIEVGLGGRLDATNLSDPAVSVITRIGFDHIQVLGRTLRRIAREKAGVMRRGRPVVIGPQPAPAREELAVQAERMGALPFWVEERSRVWDEGVTAGGVSFSCWTELGGGRVHLPILGRHQIENCRIALTVLGIVARNEPQVRFEPVARALSGLVIPARCQLLRSAPPLLVDSCHNPDSGAALAGVIRDCFNHKVVLIYGSLRRKLIMKTLAPIVPYVDTAIAVEVDSPRAIKPTILKGIFRRFGVLAEVAPGLQKAFSRAEELSAGRLPIVVAGSFYLAGEFLKDVAPNYGVSLLDIRK